jgi:hypothetical protein
VRSSVNIVGNTRDVAVDSTGLAIAVQREVWGGVHRAAGFPQVGARALDVPSVGEKAGDVFDEMVSGQNGIVTRTQALAAGITADMVRARLASGQRQRIFTGVYATFSGPVPRHSLLWAALLRAGSGAVLSQETAAALAGLAGRPVSMIHITVPSSRTLLRIPGVVIHRTRTVSRHPIRTLGRTA